MTHELRPLVDILTDLPTLPAVATRLLGILGNPESSAADITLVLEQDMALSARLLRVVNSPFYGFQRRIQNIGQAVVIVGFQHLRTMALSLSVIDSLGRANARLDYPGFWRHALSCAIWARELTHARHPALAESAYLAGLLHDVGKLILGLLDDDAFAAVVAEQRARGELFIAAERRVLPYDHAQLGAALLEHWNLPETVAYAVGAHHAPDAAVPPGAEERRVVASAVHVADILTRAMLVGWAGDARIPRMAPAAWARVGGRWDAALKLVPEVRAERGRAEAFLTVGADKRG